MGWLVLGDEAWDVTGHQMKIRLEATLVCHPVRPWSGEINARKQKLLSRLNGGSMLRMSACIGMDAKLLRRSGQRPILAHVALITYSNILDVCQRNPFSAAYFPQRCAPEPCAGPVLLVRPGIYSYIYLFIDTYIYIYIHIY